MIDATDAFAERPRVWATAYRLLGSVTDADDAVQTVLLRWLESAPSDVESPIAWLTTAVTRLCIDELRSARRKRVTYVGPWLPEPLLLDEQDPATDVVLAESVSMAMLVVLETLGPDERAVFVLREVFGFDYDEIASAVGKSTPAVRQVAHRARDLAVTPIERVVQHEHGALDGAESLQQYEIRER